VEYGNQDDLYEDVYSTDATTWARPDANTVALRAANAKHSLRTPLIRVMSYTTKGTTGTGQGRGQSATRKTLLREPCRPVEVGQADSRESAPSAGARTDKTGRSVRSVQQLHTI
jgi:hypothetical protein